MIARGETGVWLAPADHPGALADDVARLPVIAIDFPQFTDGRGYSTRGCCASAITTRGELRAIGDVARDQLYYLAQCGFDAFLIPRRTRRGRRADAFADFSDGYQSTTARAPWFQRRQAAATPGDVWFPCA